MLRSATGDNKDDCRRENHINNTQCGSGRDDEMKPVSSSNKTSTTLSPSESPGSSTTGLTTTSTRRSSSQKNDDWLSMLPTILDQRQLHWTNQTIESAQKLQSNGLLGNFTETQHNQMMSSQVEQSLLESFLEDDYDGLLHLTTIDLNSNNTPIGFVFWRELPPSEMNEWINWDHLRQRLIGEQKQRKLRHQHHNRTKTIQEEDDYDEDDASSSSSSDNDDGKSKSDSKGIGKEDMSSIQNRRELLTRNKLMQRSSRKVQKESIRWLEIAANSNTDGSGDDNGSLSNLNASFQSALAITKNPSTSALVQEFTHSWIKIELLMVHPKYFQQKLGTLLLASAMYQANQSLGRNNDGHVILHVAGGNQNVPALRLYSKLGFIKVPQDTIFHKPDRDLFVLGHIKESLQSFYWSGLLLPENDKKAIEKQ